MLHARYMFLFTYIFYLICTGAHQCSVVLEIQKRILTLVPATKLECHIVAVRMSFVLLQFPYCDGSHTVHNKETEDNVGPLVMQCKKK